MDEEIQKFINENEIIAQYLNYPKNELETIRMYINLKLIDIHRESEKSTEALIINTCINDTYSYLDYVLSFKNRVDSAIVARKFNLEKLKAQNVCEYCKCNICVKRSAVILIDQIDNYNQNHLNKLTNLDVIDFILKRKSPQFDAIPLNKFFEDVDIIDLMYVQVILENDLVILTKLNEEEKIAEFDYLDLSHKHNGEYYINTLLSFYENQKGTEALKIDFNDLNNIFHETNVVLRRYKIAAFYKYLIENKKIDIIKKLREILNGENVERGLKIRVHYYKYRYFQKVENLPYSKRTKEKIYSILNYILSYRYKPEIPFIPINILIYSNDKEGVETISKIIGEFMWFFGYLSEQMSYYNEYMNDIVLDKYRIKRIYFDDQKRKNGLLLIHNFDNLMYVDYMQQNLILNILTDEMEKNNNKVCTIIYGERDSIKQILSNHHKLSQKLINLELEIDDLDVDKICELIISKLENNVKVSASIRDKIYNYVKATYFQSNIKNMEYVNRIYNLIILNMNSSFSVFEKPILTLNAIPEAYNFRDLPEITKDINALVGLKAIKEQINDLTSLLKFNNKANIDISNFNLHMVFTGNPGTGKTTVARLITDVFFDLGYIKQNKLTEITAKDLIGEYLGQTSGKTFNVVKSALGGVLFIDEAYAITSGTADGNQYGNECISTLLKLMEDYKDKLIIIFAGYEEEMNHFLESNSGLISRIGYRIKFPDYTLEELTEIYLNLLNKNNLKITDNALIKLQNVIQEASKHEDFGNARYINTVFQKILIEHSKNMESKNYETNLYEISEEDIIPEKLKVESKIKRIGFNTIRR